ncbi:MAG: hypothetical protein AAGD86_02140 [Pseudomonadota bacterium]
MSAVDWYWPGLLVAAVAQVADGLCLYRAQGRLNTGSALASTIEFGWLVVSVFVLLTGRLHGAASLAAVLYVSYNLAGIVQGIALLRRHGDLESFAVPRWMVLLGIASGAAFALTALAQLGG